MKSIIKQYAVNQKIDAMDTGIDVAGSLISNILARVIVNKIPKRQPKKTDERVGKHIAEKGGQAQIVRAITDFEKVEREQITSAKNAV